MPRLNRFTLPDLPHHITQRGNHRAQVFFRSSDYELYVSLLTRYATMNGVAIHGYCLMPNHVHLIATPPSALSLSLMMQSLQSRYSRKLNARLHRAGHCWQGRFYGVALDDDHFRTAMVYVEQNPIRANLVPSPQSWPWSSARAHLTGDSQGLLDLTAWRLHFDPANWKSIVELGLRNAALIDRIREATRSGRPLGSDEFLKRLEAKFQVQFPPPRGEKPVYQRAPLAAAS